MFDQELFSKNLSLLALVNAPLAEKVSSLALNGQSNFITACLTKGEENAQIEQGEKSYLLHSPEGPTREAQLWYQSLSLENCDVLYIYGMGLSYLYRAAIPWLKAHPMHCLVFLEDELSVIHFWLGTAQAEVILKDIQVDIRDFSKIQEDLSAIRLLTQDNLLKLTTITALPSYKIHKLTTFTLLQDLIAFEAAEQNIRYQELAQFGMTFFNNFYRNLLQLPRAYFAPHLFDKFKDIPAIICGAGPSLTKQLPLLKTLNQRALLFGPGSALNILSYEGLLPHFGVSIDPTTETFHRQIMNRAFETPIFYRNRIYHEALTAIHGPRLFLPSATFYRTPQWFESQLGLEAPKMKGGYNVIHTTIEIARFLGCNPIIFVGLDLSFEANQSYAGGVERHLLFPHPIEHKTHLGPPIQVQDVKGKPLWSYWPWIAEAQWTEIYSRTHSTLTFINASEAGIGLFSIPNMPLEDVAKNYLSKTYAIEERVHALIQEAGLIPIEPSQIERCIDNFYQSLKSCEALVLRLLKEIDAASSSHLNIFPTEIIQQEEAQLKEESGFDYLLKQFDDFFLTLIQKNLRHLKRLPNPQEQARYLAQLTKERYQFLLQTVALNLKIIENSLKEHADSPALAATQPKEGNAQLSESASNSKVDYYPSGAIYCIQTLYGQCGRRQRYYYADGTLKTELNYQNGSLDGVVRLYYPNGQLKRELHFNKGQREGMEKSWYENGQLFTETDYNQNVAKRARCWFPDGTLGKDIVA